MLCLEGEKRQSRLLEGHGAVGRGHILDPSTQGLLSEALFLVPQSQFGAITVTEPRQTEIGVFHIGVVGLNAVQRQGQMDPTHGTSFHFHKLWWPHMHGGQHGGRKLAAKTILVQFLSILDLVAEGSQQLAEDVVGKVAHHGVPSVCFMWSWRAAR